MCTERRRGLLGVVAAAEDREVGLLGGEAGDEYLVSKPRELDPLRAGGSTNRTREVMTLVTRLHMQK